MNSHTVSLTDKCVNCTAFRYDYYCNAEATSSPPGGRVRNAAVARCWHPNKNHYALNSGIRPLFLILLMPILKWNNGVIAVVFIYLLKQNRIEGFTDLLSQVQVLPFCTIRSATRHSRRETTNKFSILLHSKKNDTLLDLQGITF